LVFLSKNTYKNAILSIINIGHDTDTTTAIVGGLAGIYNGLNEMPKERINATTRVDDIIELGIQLNDDYGFP
jgi:ADP-ribosylglycohydrolase